MSNITNPLSMVMNQLRIATSDEQPIRTEFVVVAGDNYYEESQTIREGKKEKKEKKVITSDLVSGFECLPKNVVVHVILGNHDLVERIGVDEFKSKNMNDSEKCYIMDTERGVVSRNPNMTFNLNNVTTFNNKTIIIMIDTTMYDTGLIDDIDTDLLCYKHYYETLGIDIGRDFNIHRLQSDQKNFVEQKISTLLSDEINNIVITGHHPITCLKVKKDETILLDNTLNGISKLLFESIYQIIPESRRDSINYYYLCADLHQYQIGEVTINGAMMINQYIVGTGGTRLDPTPDIEPGKINRNKSEHQFQISYIITPEQFELCGERYGFLECYDVPDGLLFTFVDIEGRRLVERKFRENFSQLLSRGGRHNRKRKLANTKKHRKTRKNTKKSKKHLKKKKVLRSKKGKNKKTRK